MLNRGLRRSSALIAVAFALALAGATGASAAPLRFTARAPLPSSPPKGDMQGGEPSVAFDSRSHGHVYVAAPGGRGPGGVNFWASADGGRTFPVHRAIGSFAGGGDADVAVGLDHTVFAADLEVAATAICRSHDFGRTFEDGCETGLPADQGGPEDDRPWLTPSRRDARTLYLTYHDFLLGFPIIEKSTDQGRSFTPCGHILQPGSSAFANFALSGTLVDKPVIGKDDSLYVPVTESSQGSGSFDSLYVAVSRGGCDPTRQFTDYTIYSHEGASLATIFDDIAQDGAGNLYAAAAGKLTSGQKTTGLYLFVSRDGGKRWSKPIQVNASALKANALPALTAGLGGGQVALGWYGTATSGDPANAKDRWRYYAAASHDFGRTFARATVTPQVFHYGDICTSGIGCEQGGNRNLLDFSSIATDPRTGCLLAVLPGDPYDTPGKENTTPAAAYVARQSGGSCLAAASRRPAPSRPRFAG